MINITFDDGVQEVNLNNKVTVYFCPTDMEFIEKVFNVAETIDKKSEEFQERVSSMKDSKGVFDEGRVIDAEIRELLNSIFDMDVCTPLFGSRRTYAAAGGLPVWANLIFAIIDALDSDFAEQKKKTNPRLQAYAAKYKRQR